MILRRRSLRRPAVLAGVLALLLAGVAGPPAGAGVDPLPDPTVVDIYLFLPPSTMIYRDCDGADHPLQEGGGGLLTRTGPLLSELTVNLELTGTLAADVESPPTSATFAAGEEQATVVFFFTGAPGPGTIGIELLPGDGYELGEEVTGSADVDEPALGIDCSDPLELDPGFSDQALQVTQTIQVGQVPAPIGLYAIPFIPGQPTRAAAPRDLSFPTADTFDTPVVGALPAGLTYADDTWGGAATTPGVSTFAVRLCNDGDLFGATVPVCIGTADVQITVVEATTIETRDNTTPGAGPARAVRTTARFTG